MVIDINDGEKTLEVDGGGTLLGTLGSNGIFLPSACGGGGTCVQCVCQVNEGGGEILPTETLTSRVRKLHRITDLVARLR